MMPAPPISVRAMAPIRTIVGSMPRCSATPAQTPATIRSWVDRVSRLGPSGGGWYGGGSSAGGSGVVVSMGAIVREAGRSHHRG